MGKALVIKNADFSANKVETITFDVDIPCTGVSFATSAVELTELGVASIGYTVTPANTTDLVTLTSSDSSVVSVSGTTITAVGIGSATLTLSCGGYTATCSVNVEITIDPIYLVGYSSTQTASVMGTDYDGLLIDGSSNTRIYCTEDYTKGNFANPLEYKNPKVVDVGNVTAIKIPANATKIHVSATNVYNAADAVKIHFIDADNQYGYGDRLYLPITSEAIPTCTVSANVWSVNEDVVIPSGATGFIPEFRVRSSSILDNATNEAAAKQIAEETLDISISYLTE